MSLVKTETGREVLLKRDRTLNPRERQILVITDGSRSRRQLVDLMGQATEAQIDRLLQLGFLKDIGNDLEEGLGKALTGVSPIKTAAPTLEARRSLVATKVYCIDMLQLIREPGAGAVMRAIQSSATEDELMDNVLLCLRYMQEKTADSYASKVAARLAEIVPQHHLASLANCRPEPAPLHH